MGAVNHRVVDEKEVIRIVRELYGIPEDAESTFLLNIDDEGRIVVEELEFTWYE